MASAAAGRGGMLPGDGAPRGARLTRRLGGGQHYTRAAPATKRGRALFADCERAATNKKTSGRRPQTGAPRLETGALTQEERRALPSQPSLDVGPVIERAAA